MTPWARNLIVANVIAFFITRGNPQLMDLFVLRVHPLTFVYRPWTLVSYMFLHAGMGHLFFNMIGLFFFAGPLEAKLGSRRFLALYFISGISGALLSFVFNMGIFMVGASAGVFGVFLGFAWFWPHQPVFIWGIVPVPARVLVVVMTVLSLYSGLSSSGDGIAHFAHLGGYLGALLYLFYLRKFTGSEKFKAKVYAQDARRLGRDSADLARWKEISFDLIHELNRDEVERLLAKAEKDGVGSLTPDERVFLNRLSDEQQGE